MNKENKQSPSKLKKQVLCTQTKLCIPGHQIEITQKKPKIDPKIKDNSCKNLVNKVGDPLKPLKIIQ